MLCDRMKEKGGDSHEKYCEKSIIHQNNQK